MTTFRRALTPIAFSTVTTLATGYSLLGLLAGPLILIYPEPTYAQTTIPAECPSGPLPPDPPLCARDRCPYPQTARVCTITPSYKAYSARYSFIDGKYLILQTNGIPEHTIGLFPML